MQNQSSLSSKLLRLPSVLDRVACSKTELYRKMKSGEFPASVRLGSKSVAWLESDIDAYIQKLTQGAAK
ncbi:AlpA family phage regulatory protein [Undibacterium sp. RTI2.1]|uniref:helix-turn-helix transcriptional regulator n=1 Tax=unclassified Undibacterium TaxID=2630295 RepID=UPI002AB54B48|nr:MULTISPECIES: AlpA family phage regulatory protein [unclassified Undibacterium]MDY7537705.1 AlpA family phage regulatory protein [Undibacterium sp. 5I1]MEB0029306.1 AlpA family phage regulatory protein [Undibacterium sp. RTI2.1]MEB0115614.1 AlpA family phage regulatory protein [Undibacterium sp. RTI2.2]MEB0230197.1 AlpA family phage regulatory protein [Undibacterium sp. 10I3]MEB0256442.1 AlpA family phage regulatory protein [Undibacterium sp. 5I1]